MKIEKRNFGLKLVLGLTFVSDIAVFVLKRDVKLQLTHSLGLTI